MSIFTTHFGPSQQNQHKYQNQQQALSLTRFESSSSQNTASLLTPVDPYTTSNHNEIQVASPSTSSTSESGIEIEISKPRKGLGLASMYQSKSIGNLKTRMKEDQIKTSRPTLGERAFTTSDIE